MSNQYHIRSYHGHATISISSYSMMEICMGAYIRHGCLAQVLFWAPGAGARSSDKEVQ